jgi:hypothetical protein
MTRRWAVAGLLVLAAATSVPVGAAPLPGDSPPVHAARAFVARAEAYPMESAPGTQETEVQARTASTRAVASNPPAAAFAEAATTDLGLAEAYVGRQGPSAGADTQVEGGAHDVTVDESGNHLEAHVDTAPTAWSQAIGNAPDASSGSLSSRSDADGSGDRLVATVEAEANDVVLGALIVGSGRFDATVEANGVPGGARAAGTIRTSDATFGGVPVVIGADGLQVDEARVPPLVVPEATALVQETFSSGGYADIRVVQPKVEVAADGTSARVFGGGVRVMLTNNDPAQRYFITYTLLGGSAEVALGGDLGVPTPARPDDAAPAAPSGSPATGGDGDGAGSGSGPDEGAGSPAPGAAPGEELTMARGEERIALRLPWTGRVWLLLAVAAAWAAALALRLGPLAGVRRRLADATDLFAERYARG